MKSVSTHMLEPDLPQGHYLLEGTRAAASLAASPAAGNRSSSQPRGGKRHKTPGVSAPRRNPRRSAPCGYDRHTFSKPLPQGNKHRCANNGETEMQL